MTNARVDRIERLVLNTRDLAATSAFYVGALGFSQGARSAEGSALELGGQSILLHDVGDWARAYPDPRAANDPWFQHFAIVVSDMEAAYARVMDHGAIPISRGGPQRLPASTGGVTAWKFRDPEGHPLELSHLPGSEDWAAVAGRDPGRIFLGIDHTALAVRDLDASLAFYIGLGFREGPRLLNQGPEQDRLDGLDGVVLDIATLFAPGGGPHIELLHYRSPGAAARIEVAASDVVATTTVLALETGADATTRLDPDGHRVRIR